MKKIVSLLLVATLILTFTACSAAPAAPAPAPAAPAPAAAAPAPAAPAAAPAAPAAESAPAAEPAPVAADATVVKYSVTYAASGIQADGANALGELIAEKSGGSLKMEFYPSSQLGDKAATFEGLRNGTIEMTECAATDLSAFNSMWSVFSLPYLWDSGSQATKTLMDPAVKEMLFADAEANGFVIIGWYDIGSRSIMNTKRLTTNPQELNGLKVRVMEDPVLAASMNAMGGIASPMAMSEVFTAMQQGTIDGVDHTPASLYDFSFHEVAKYLTLTEHFTIPGVVFVSKVWYDGLSAENQQAILSAGEAWSEKWNNEMWPAATQAGVDNLKAAGVEIAEIDKSVFVQATQSVVDDFVANATAEQKALYELLVEVREKY